MNTTKKGLGKGLQALLSDAGTDITGRNSAPLNSVSEIPINEIEANPFQPRELFEDSSLDALVESIKLHGIIQPVTVRKMGYGKYQLISGERRTRAAIRAELKTIPAYVRVADDKGMLEMSLIENIQRDDLNPIEIGIGYKRLIDECTLTQEEVSQRIGVNRSTVTNYLRILKLPDEIQLGLRDRAITMGHAKMLAGIENEELQVKAYQSIVENNLTVRDLEELVKKLRLGDPDKPFRKVKNKYVPQFQNWEEKFSVFYNARVRIKSKANGTGLIMIPFKNESELKKLASLFENDE